jgi:alpha-1,6-mannosyltransferase
MRRATAQPARNDLATPVPRVGLVAGGWALVCLATLALSAWLVALAPRFQPGTPLIEMPALEVAAGMVAAGLVWLLVLPLVPATLAFGPRAARAALFAGLAVGFVARLLQFHGVPVFEDDWYRYLWDGAVVAHGLNPYLFSPEEAGSLDDASPWYDLVTAAGDVFERINHPALRTIYPPVAEAAFALAYLIRPFSLDAWRLVCLGGEVVTLGLLLALLRTIGRPGLWALLYWLSPVAIKELANAVHMEAIVLPLVLAAVLAGARGRHLQASLWLGFAIGAKLWPILLAPVLLRPLLAHPRRLLVALAILGGLTALWAWPILVTTLDRQSGFVAYAEWWRNNSAHLGLVEGWVRDLLRLVASPEPDSNLPGRLARGLLALAAGTLALWFARAPIRDARDLAVRASLVTAAVLLLSPAQFPWYALWVLPFLAVLPSRGLILLAALIPVYYASFHWAARQSYGVYTGRVVWLIWAPVWLALAIEIIRVWRAGLFPFEAGKGDGEAGTRRAGGGEDA